MTEGRTPEPTGTEQFVLAVNPESVLDIRTCEALHRAKMDFQNALVESAAQQERHFVKHLRMEPVYQIAEFFFLVQTCRLDSDKKIRRYAELHNEYLQAMLADRPKMHRLCLNPTRVRKGMFSPDNVAKLVENYRAGTGAIDQSDLSRFLIHMMSPETCRKTTLVLAEAGYLERWRSPYQSVLVRSTGALELNFTRSLRSVRSALASLFAASGPACCSQQPNRNQETPCCKTDGVRATDPMNASILK